MARILVTGGCGYIGSHTIVDLVKHGLMLFPSTISAILINVSYKE